MKERRKAMNLKLHFDTFAYLDKWSFFVKNFIPYTDP